MLARNPNLKVSAKVASNHSKILRKDFRAIAEAVREVAAGNGIDNPDLIFVGQVIDLSATAPAPEYRSSSQSSSSESSDSSSEERR